MADKLIRRPAVSEITSLSRSAIYAKLKEGKFPLPVRLGARSVAWREADIRAWVESRPKAGGA